MFGWVFRVQGLGFRGGWPDVRTCMGRTNAYQDLAGTHTPNSVV